MHSTSELVNGPLRPGSHRARCPYRRVCLVGRAVVCIDPGAICCVSLLFQLVSLFVCPVVPFIIKQASLPFGRQSGGSLSIWSHSNCPIEFSSRGTLAATHGPMVVLSLRITAAVVHPNCCLPSSRTNNGAAPVSGPNCRLR